MQRRFVFLPLLLLVTAPGPVQAQAAARSIVDGAYADVAQDRARTAIASWDNRLRRDPSDRSAQLARAMLAALTYDYATADRLFTRLYARDSIAPDQFSVYARLAHGRTWMVRRNQAERVRNFERALESARKLRDRRAEAEALIEVSNTRAIGRGLDVGLATIDSATPLLAADEYELHTLRLQRRVVFLAALGRPDLFETANQAMAMARRSGSQRAIATALRGLGHAHYAVGRYDSAVAILRQAEGLYRRVRDRVAVAGTISDRSNALAETGDLAQARDAAHAQIEEGTAAGAQLAAIAGHNALGLVSFRIGDLAAAREQFRLAERLQAAAGDSVALLTTRLLVADIHAAAGNIDSARALTQLIAERQLARNDHDSYFETQQGLLWLLLAERRLGEARRQAAHMRVLQRRHGFSIRELPYQEGLLASLEGDLPRAERLFAGYLASLDSTERGMRWGVRLQLADLKVRRGQLDAALEEMRAGNRELDGWRARLPDAELRKLVFQTSFFSRSEEVEAHARVVAALATGGRASSAFELAERQRARELADRLTRAAAIRGGATARTPSVAASRSGGLLTAADAVASVPPGSALLQYVAGGRAPTTLFVVTSAGVHGHVLPSVDSLAPGIGRLAALVADGADAVAIASGLGAVLIAPASEALRGVRRIVIVPDDRLHQLPFDVLVLPDGKRVVEHWAVSISPSASVTVALARARRTAPRRATSLLVFGDPVFAESRDEGAVGRGEVYRSAFDAAGGLARLPESGREARLVARYADHAEVRLRQDASAAFLKRTPLEAFSVIHFATHALVDERTLARTALALAPGGGESGFVTPGDLAMLRLDTDLVVLSACRTAGGVIIDGEGVQGLTAPLLQAGARSVVATSWRISDRSTVAFIRDFYDALAKGLPVAEALREAKLEAIGRGAPPSEWAAFQLIGDPLVRVPLRTPAWRPDANFAALAGATLLLLGAALYGARRVSRRAADRRSVPSPAWARTHQR